MFGGLLGTRLPSMQQVLNSSPPAERWPAAAERAVALQPPGVAGATLGPEAPLRSWGAPESTQPMPWHQIIEVIREETRLAASAMAASQAPQATQQPMQLIINNHAEAKADQRTVNAMQPTPTASAPPEKQAPSSLMSALASPVNRLCLFSAVALGLYILQGQLQHKWRMAEMQRRLDANLFVRVTQMFSAATR
mmetsp:Transcript_54919/g.141429  ORF Transcript_54919/g.141429 Transcript_54919/m.141429 type:complete len:194 (+) Transcript_54919:88-669(+)